MLPGPCRARLGHAWGAFSYVPDQHGRRLWIPGMGKGDHRNLEKRTHVWPCVCAGSCRTMRSTTTSGEMCGCECLITEDYAGKRFGALVYGGWSVGWRWLKHGGRS